MFPDSIFVEYYYGGTGIYTTDFDWNSVFYIFRKINGRYVLVGLTRKSFTIY